MASRETNNQAGCASRWRKEWYRRLRSQGVTIGSTIDCVIAKLAAENAVLLLSRDRDMQHIVDSKLLDLRSLPVV